MLHTPGHTPGSACYHIGDNLITGDTLFVFGCGRCDLSGGDPEQMFDTLRTLREGLPGGTTIHPGHNYAERPVSSLEEQAECNPFMRFRDVGEFVHYRMHLHDQIRSTPYQPECGGDCEVWTRVMGYHRPVSAWNPGKQAEQGERRYFNEPRPSRT